MTRQQGRFARGAVLAVTAFALAGCFDLFQSVGIGRDGAGHYHVAASASGFIGEGLRNAKLVSPDLNRATQATTDVNGKVTRTADVDFKSLSDLALSDETMSLKVTGHDLFGLGQSHVAFHTTFLVDKAKRHQQGDDTKLGREIAQTILGDHTYTFSVTVPGDIEHANPVAVGGETFQPEVKGDFYNGRTVTWRLPLYTLADAQALDFEVDFVALGFFHDAKTQLAAH